MRIELLEVGRQTKTVINIIYLQNMAPKEVVDCFRSRIESAEANSILDSTNLEEWIQDKTLSPFPTLLETERPDVATSHILEGRVVVLVDNSPFALVGPITLFQFFFSTRGLLSESGCCDTAPLAEDAFFSAGRICSCCLCGRYILPSGIAAEPAPD